MASDPIDLTHLDDDHTDAAQSCERCPVCDDLVPLAALPAHCEAHFADQTCADAREPPDDGTVACEQCGARIGLEDLDSHLLAHELSAEEVQAPAEDELDRAAEELYFRELRAKYGFEDPERPGRCHICGQPSHWARECPDNPTNRVAQARVVAPQPHLIQSTQQPAGLTKVPGGLVPQLAECLRAQHNLPAGVRYQALLCAPVDHYQGDASDGGWGCGYRNLQMQLSHLLQARQDAREVLFGGCGFVPDIPALQAWLECAWAAGFDVQGAEQLGGHVQGTRKWIGTTEVAALLRYFGVRARIIDFGVTQQGQQAQQQELQRLGVGSSSSSSGGSGGGTGEVHVGVACDGCGRCPILGPRYHSQVVPDYDLCASCHERQADGNAAPFARLMAGRAHFGGASDGRAPAPAGGCPAGRRPHDRLMRWVWDYFSSAGEQAQPSGGDSSCQRGEAPAGPAAERDSTAARPSGAQQGQQEELQRQLDQALAAIDAEAGGGARDSKRPRAGAWPDSASSVAPQFAAPPGVDRQQQQGLGGAAQQGAPGRPLAWAAPPARGGGPPGRQQGQQAQHTQQGPSVVCTGRPPLYFQHQGHSRTIVGIERRQKQGGKGAGAEGAEFTLLVLDPGCPMQPLCDALLRRAGWQRMVKRGQHTLRKPQYQLLYCEPGLAAAGSAEHAALKLVAAAERY